MHSVLPSHPELAAQLALYRQFFDQFGDEMYVHDAQGQILSANAAACHNLGYSEQALHRMNIADISIDIHPSQLLQLWAAHPTDHSTTVTNRHQRQDGQMYGVQVHLTCQETEGQRYFLVVAKQTDAQRQQDAHILQLNARLQALVQERTQQLKESSRLLNAVMEQTPDAVFIKDQQGRYQYANAALAQQLQRPLADIMGRTDHDLYPHQEAQMFLRTDKETLERGSACTFEGHLLINGQRLAINAMKTPYRDEHGRVIGILGITRDVTEIRRAQDITAHNYEMLCQAEQLAKIGSWTLDLNSNTFSSSEMLAQMNGVGPNDPPLTPETLSAMISPQEHEILSAAIRNCIAHGTAYTVDVQHKRPGGGYFPGRIRGQAWRDSQGQITMLHGTLQDLSEHAEAQQRLQSLADHLPNGAIFRCEQIGLDKLYLRYVSAGIVSLLGLSASALIDHPSALANCIHPQDRSAFFAKLHSCLGNQSAFLHICRMQHIDGNIYWMRMRAMVRHTHEGIFWEGILLNVTAEHQAQQALQEAKEAAEAAEKAKSEFLATMSHEIRTPMNTVIGMTHLLQQTPITAKQRNYLNKVSQSANALLNIINDILDFSKLEAHMLQLHHQQFALDELLETITSVTGLSAEQKGIEVIYHVAPNTPRHWLADVQRLQQVLTNLVGNAIKFTDRGEVLISIHAQALASDTTSHEYILHVRVRDTGIGIAPQHMAQLFEPFTQADANTSRRFGGTGLGLAICRKLLQQMGGDIHASSQLGQGSEFTFHLPLQAQPAPKKPTVELPQCHVLVVDDNQVARDVLQNMVQSFGLTCNSCASAAEALQALQIASDAGMPYQLILMDWQMPGMDGLALAEHIRAHAQLSCLPAMLMVTAYCRDDVVARVQELGLQGLLIKPVTASTLLNALQEALQLQRPADYWPPITASHDLQSATALLQGQRILVVDDNAFNREVARDLLALAGVQATCAHNGSTALQLLAQQAFDAVLLDIQMPGMDGLEVARRIRTQAQLRHLPVWALTAQARLQDHQAIIDSGMDGHITKPIDAQLLYRTLIQALKLSAPKSTQGIPAASSRAVAQPIAPENALGHPERQQRLIQAFVKDFDQAPQQLLALHQQANWPELAMLAHTLRGALGYMAQPQCLHDMQQLEAACTRQVVPWSIAQQASQQLAQVLHTLRASTATATSDLSQPNHTETNTAPSFATLLDWLQQAQSAVQRSDFAAVHWLEQVERQLRGHTLHALAAQALALCEDLEVAAALQCIEQLRGALQSKAHYAP